jgi:hypothetical protein
MIVSGMMSLQPMRKVGKVGTVESLQPRSGSLEPRTPYPARPRRRSWAAAEQIAEWTPVDARRPAEQKQIDE